jgi:hypothetical protein
MVAACSRNVLPALALRIVHAALARAEFAARTCSRHRAHRLGDCVMAVTDAAMDDNELARASGCRPDRQAPGREL